MYLIDMCTERFTVTSGVGRKVGPSPAMFVATKQDVLWRPQDISSPVRGVRTACFLRKPWDISSIVFEEETSRFLSGTMVFS